MGNFFNISGYCTVIKSVSICCTTNGFGCFRGIRTLEAKVSEFDFGCSFSCWVFKSLTEWSNAQHVRAPTTRILSTTASSSHSLNCFGHVSYAPRSSMFQNISKLSTHPNVYVNWIRFDNLQFSSLQEAFITSTFNRGMAEVFISMWNLIFLIKIWIKLLFWKSFQNSKVSFMDS